ncbi:MAG: ATP-binding protein [Paludibacteraceae bacterium]|nr:ATP-binding protein [Paludibacteraceae bacterium]
MQRSIYKQLLQWKDSANRKPLILLGARQVGKTYILKEFGHREFSKFIYINCHNNSFVTALFRDFNIERILYDIGQEYETEIIIGETLIFFDEIQETHNGLSVLKYFCEEKRELHIVVAGSLLGISLKEDESYPVGKIDTLRLYPMSFIEFLYANNRHKLCESVETQKWESLSTSSETLTNLLRQYYFCGGMPEAVQEWVNTKDTTAVRKIQSDIIDAYERDISKHTKVLAQRIHLVWNSVPAQLSKENKKFIFGLLKKGARANEFEIALQWLCDAGIVYKVQQISTPKQPLKFYQSDGFKIYLLDCGLLACMSGIRPKDLLLGMDIFTEFKGAFTENFVLQQIIADTATIFPRQTFYYSKDNSQMEIDFLIESPNRTIPIEVKAGNVVHSKSLYNFINNDFAQLKLKGVRFSLLPYTDQDWMENVPLYGINGYLQDEFRE